VNVRASVDVRFSPTGPWYHQEHTIPLNHVVRVIPPSEIGQEMNESAPPSLTDLERDLLNEFGEEIGAPSGLVAQNLGISTAKVTSLAKSLAARGLLEDTGYAMRFSKRDNWQYIDKPKTEGGMTSKPGASTVWRTTPAGHAALAG
jgi:hypothetical protein